MKLRDLLIVGAIVGVGALGLNKSGCSCQRLPDSSYIPGRPPVVRQEPPREKSEPTNSYEKKLRNAAQIKIDERSLKLEKFYDLVVDGEKVGEVSGKIIAPFGDRFTLKTVDGKVIGYEDEIKRFLRLNRAAICYDERGNTSGFIGEEVVKDFFSINYIFHIYDAEKREVGVSKKFTNSFLGRHKLYDLGGNEDYDIDRKFVLVGGDTYILTVKNPKSDIPLEHAILMTCIEDAIGDSEKAK